MVSPKITAIITAGGSSTRMGGKNKIFSQLNGKLCIAYSLLAFQNSPYVSGIVVSARASDIPQIKDVCKAENITKLLAVCKGGACRAQSVYNAAKCCPDDTDFVLVHDAARPFVNDDIITRVVEALSHNSCVACGVTPKDTVAEICETQVTNVPNRANLFNIQTPQGLNYRLYLNALKRFEDGLDKFTDDCSILRAAGETEVIVEGDYRNIKITTPEDILIAEAFLRGDSMLGMRVGHGYDVHRLTKNRKLILGGVEIEYELGLLGHSDADVLLHAVCDSLLGAAGLGDIGKLFPDTDDSFKDIDSRILLRRVAEILREKGFRVSNIDATVIAQRPKLAPFIEQMAKNIADDCGIARENVNVKATTEEGLGFTGSGEGIAAHCVSVIQN